MIPMQYRDQIGGVVEQSLSSLSGGSAGPPQAAPEVAAGSSHACALLQVGWT